MVKQYFSKKYIESVYSLFLFFMIRILFSSLVSVFLLDQGYSALNVSAVSAAALAASFFAVPIIGKYIDAYGAKHTSAILLFVSSISGIAFAFSKSLLLSGLSYCVVMICINTLHPIIERQATQIDFIYGSVRIWGTIGNATGTQLGGILYQYISPRSVYITFALVSITAWLALDKVPKNAGPGCEGAASKGNTEHIKTSHVFLLYIIVVFLFYAALDTKTLYLTAFLRTSDFSINEASTILFLASLLEIPVVLFGGRLVDKLPGKRLIFFCLMLLFAQLSIYALLGSHGVIIAATLLTNSVVSMLYIMVNMKVINEIIDTNHQLSALTVTTGVRSLAAVVGQTIGGRLIDVYSYQHFFMLLSVFTLLAMLLTLVIKFPDHNDNPSLYT